MREDLSGAARGRPAGDRVDTVARALARNRLGVGSVVVMVAGAVAPFTIVAGLVPTAFAQTGLLGVPVAFAAVAVVLLLFAGGFIAMGRLVPPNAGGLYAFIAAGLGRPLGLGAGWLATVVYTVLQIALYGAIGAQGQVLLAGLGMAVPWWVVALAAWAVVAALGLARIDLNRTVLAVFLAAEAAVLVVFTVANLANPAAGRVSTETLEPAALLGPGVGALLVIGLLGYVGFENGVVYGEEARDAARTVATATVLSVVVIGVLYTAASWALTVATGPDRIVDAARELGPGVVFGLAAENLHPGAADVGLALFVTSLLVAAVTFHNSVARYAFALGRERLLPPWLGRTSARYNSPWSASLTQSGVAFVVITTYAVAGWRPMEDLFFVGGAVGGLGVLTLLTLTAVAVTRHLTRHRRAAGGSWATRTLVPGVAALVLATFLWLAVDGFDRLLGVAPTDPLRFAVPLIYAGVLLAGVAAGLVLRRRRPEVYRRIGLGPGTRTDAHATPGVPGAAHAAGTGRAG
jgi:amino acid transporter